MTSFLGKICNQRIQVPLQIRCSHLQTVSVMLFAIIRRSCNLDSLQRRQSQKFNFNETVSARSYTITELSFWRTWLIITQYQITRIIRKEIFRTKAGEWRPRPFYNSASSDQGFAIRQCVKTASVYCVRGLRRPGSDCAYAQADPGLRSPIMPEDLFSHGQAQIINQSS